MRNIEQELKLNLTEREYNLVVATTDQFPRKMTNFYFQCEDMSCDTMLRIRQIGDNFVLCYKRRLSHDNGVMVCDEREIAVDKNFCDNALNNGLSFVSLNKMFDTNVFDATAYYVGSLETQRIAFELEGCSVELDKCSYLGNVDYELECECRHVDQLEKLKNYLNYTFGIVIRPSVAKNKRFLDALAKQQSLSTATDND